MADVPVRLTDTVWCPENGSFSLGPISAAGREGRFIAVVGPNGAGKSSMLNLVGGIIRPVSGGVEVFGKAPSEWKARERGQRMAYLSQDPERPFGFPVSEYVALGRFPANGPFRAAGNADREMVRRELAEWELEHLADRSVTSLSGGEFQRVRLARSFCQEPGLLLLDEPGNHLDLTSRMGILERLRKDAAGGRCTIAVLHDVNDALLYADEVWLMDRGKIIAAGQPEKVLTPGSLEEVYGMKLTPFRDSEGQVMLGVPAGGQ